MLSACFNPPETLTATACTDVLSDDLRAPGRARGREYREPDRPGPFGPRRQDPVARRRSTRGKTGSSGANGRSRILSIL